MCDKTVTTQQNFHFAWNVSWKVFKYEKNNNEETFFKFSTQLMSKREIEEPGSKCQKKWFKFL